LILQLSFAVGNSSGGTLVSSQHAKIEFGSLKEKFIFCVDRHTCLFCVWLKMWLEGIDLMAYTTKRTTDENERRMID